MNTKAFENVKKELDLLAAEGMPLCGVMVRRNHEKLFEYGVSIDKDQRLFLYSCSKPMTIAGVMRLVERGLIGLDDPVSQYLPAYAEAFILQNGGFHRCR
ncbi:MAG: beta-lactamase family protein [Firmicutes bacterium]|nr:beta-lactamase family protein [Bacillota bacterium]